MHKPFTALSLLCLILCAGFGCSHKNDKDLVMISLEDGQRLVAGEKSLLGGTKAAVWVDARTRVDYDAGHSPGAISLPFERVTPDHYLIENEPTVIVYGADYNDSRAKAMSKRLLFELLEGHDIRTLDGGIRAWTAAGNELETTKSGG